MKKILQYSVNKAVGTAGTAALIQAVGMASVPLVADGRHRVLDGAGLSRYAYDTKKLLDSTGSGSFLQSLPRCRFKTTTAIL